MNSLAGVRVLELSEGWSASAVGGRLLADLGATVDKIEPAEGDPIRRLGPAGPGGDSLASVSMLLGKRCHRLGAEAYGERLRELGARADVLLLDDTWRARLAPWGLAAEAGWRELNPGLVGGVSTAFGTGPGAAGRHGSEFVLQAVGGVAALNGHDGSPPSRAGVPLATNVDALLTVGAVLAALYRRGRGDGGGAWIDVAGYDAMVMMQGNFMPAFFHSGKVPQRVGNVQLLSAPWNAYPTIDGLVVIVAISEGLWRRLLTVMGRTDLIGDPRYQGKLNRVRLRSEVDGIISAWTSTRTGAEIAAALDAAKVAVGEVKTIGDLLADPHLADRGLLREVRVDGHAVPAWGSIFRMEDASPAAAEPVPARPVPARGAGPLAGLRVLELGGHTAGGMSTRMLADLGADVIKVELPQGDNSRDTAPLLADGSAYLWHFWNTGKRSVVLNLGDPRGHAVLEKLVAQADILLENMAPDTVEKLRLTHEVLGRANPRLIYCAVSGFGMHGAKKYRRAFDAVLQAETGIMSVTGAEGGEPVKCGPSVVDNTTALASVTAIVAALHRRERTGAGVFIDMALFDAAAWLTTEWWPLVWGGGDARPMGNRHPYHALHNSFRAADGRLVAVTAQTDAEREAARELLGLGDDEGGWDKAAAAWVAGRPAAEVVDACQGRGIPAGVLNDLSEVVAHPLTRERELLPEIEITRTERCYVIGTPYKFAGEPPMLAGWRRVPALGEHTEEILRDLLGLDDADRAALRDAGITTRRAAHE